MSRQTLTVGSLRGQPQASRPFTPKRGPETATLERPRGCCGSGCAGCPYGQMIRARLGLPQVPP